MTEAIHEILGADEKRRVVFHVRGDAIYSWTEEAFLHSDPEEHGHPYDYWTPVRGSGLFGSLADAEADAAVDLPWLGSLLIVTPPPAPP